MKALPRESLAKSVAEIDLVTCGVCSGDWFGLPVECGLGQWLCLQRDMLVFPTSVPDRPNTHRGLLVEFKKEAESKREPVEVVAVTCEEPDPTERFLSLSSSWYVLCRRIAIWWKAFEWHLSNKKKVSKVKVANVKVAEIRLCRYILVAL